MKLLSLLTVLLAAAAIPSTAQAPGVTFLDHEKVAAALAKGGVLTSASNLIVQGASRNAPGQVEIHDKETDVLYIVDGEATFVTGEFLHVDGGQSAGH